MCSYVFVSPHTFTHTYILRKLEVKCEFLCVNHTVKEIRSFISNSYVEKLCISDSHLKQKNQSLLCVYSILSFYIQVDHGAPVQLFVF